VYLAEVADLPHPAEPPIAGLSVRRSVGMNGTRLSAVVGEEAIGYIEVETFEEGERLSRHGGWADIGNLHIAEQHRRRGVAYPFSALPTRHRVQISGEASVFAVCAIDALSISAMTGRPVVIESADPSSGQPVTVHVDGATSSWDPATAVVYVGRTGGDCAGPSASVCCGSMNFFATRAAASA
jgi:Alkylmercury lyase